MSKRAFIESRTARIASVALLLACLSLGYLLATRGNEEAIDLRLAHPVLFPASHPCGSGPHVDVDAHARRLERYALLHAERYPYDPADGVRAVLHFLRAASCYTSAARGNDAIRVTRRAKDLSFRIETDYASARIALEKTLASKNWSSALLEVHRLLRLTRHLQPSPYTTWLQATLGKVAARANEVP